jgi:Ca2+/Na+ antiporter
MVILDFVSAMLLMVYVIAENRYLPTVRFEILFAVMAMAMAVLSYLYNDFTSLAITSIVFLLVAIRIMKMMKLVEPRVNMENKENNENENKENNNSNKGG